MIQVINRALDILEYIALEPDNPKSLSVIATNFDLNAGTCANIIKTLVERKYIEKIDKKGYCLGANAYALTGNEGYQKDLVKASKKEMERLSSRYNENILLSTLIKDTRTAVVRVSGTHDIQVLTTKEKRAYDTSTGRLLIALLPEPELNAFIEKYGLPSGDEWSEVSDEVVLREKLQGIKIKGFAKQLTRGNIVGFAVPIYSSDKVVASLGLYMPQYRFKAADEKKLIKDLLQTAAIIKNNLSR